VSDETERKRQSSLGRLQQDIQQRDERIAQLEGLVTDLRRQVGHLHIRAADRLYGLSRRVPILHRPAVELLRPAVRAWLGAKPEASPDADSAMEQSVPAAVEQPALAQPMSESDEHRTLVAGWFSIASFGRSGATAGDLQALELVRTWLLEAGRPFDVASIPEFPGGVDWTRVPPKRYDQLLLVCGPFMPQQPRFAKLLKRFAHCRLLGLNLSILDPADARRFSWLVERDGPDGSRPDITFLDSGRLVPVVGVVRAQRQPEYGLRGRHPEADLAIDRLLASSPVVKLDIDTRLVPNPLGLRSPEEIESLIARLDVVVSTRLHAMVHALKHGVPVVAIDPIARGGKVLAQARSIGWPIVFSADTLDDGELRRALEYCSTPEARALAQQCAARARESAREIERKLKAFLY
jgi:hypothetical protein